MHNILIVEDEKPISDFIKLSLRTMGYECEQVYDGEEAANKILEKRYSLILLDIMLPKADGFELMEFIRPMEIPVIFLTAKGSVQDKVKGFKLGADDYLTKPFQIEELQVRVENVLRRYYKTNEILSYRNISVDVSSHKVTKDEQEVTLSEKEFKLLVLFINNKNLALFREQIYERVWEGEYTGDSRTVDMHIQRLRKKLDLYDQLVSVFKIGYRLEE
ncbi:MAG: response regulator transcription factor [Hungatella sp.]|nr:response regulator transcription factor [Hungatella sp.]